MFMFSRIEQGERLVGVVFMFSRDEQGEPPLESCSCSAELSRDTARLKKMLFGG